MAHTQAINEAAPANTDNVSGGAASLRDLKRDIRQREELEHYWNDALTGDQEDGKHINITQVGTGIIANKELVKSTGYSLTGSNAQSAITQTGTWNTTGTPTFWKGSITDTASNAASRFIAWLVGGAEKFAVDKAGDLSTIKGVSYSFPSSQGAANTTLKNNGSGTLTWATTANSIVAGTGIDVSAATGDVTITLDLSELTTSTADGDGDYFAVVDAANAQKKLTKANISIAGFNTAVATSITGTGTIASGTWQGTDIGVAYGGTGVSTLTDGGLLVGSGASAITALGVATNGQIPIGDGSGDPQLANITGTSNEIEITNGSASIQVGIVTNPTLGVSNFTGTLANARLPTNIDVGGTLDVTGVITLDSDVACSGNTLFVDQSEGAVGFNTGAPEKKIHIFNSDSGVTPNANTCIFIEKGSGAQWIEFAAPDGTGEGGGILFSDVTAGGVGSINYNHSIEKLQLGHDVAIGGALSKGSGSFNIDHPLPSKTETHRLVHSFIEGPQCDLIYRGTATLSSGEATVNLDTASGMTEGTWVLLCRNEQCFTSNETGWTSVRGSVTGNILTIECEEGTSADTISWMVVAERHDTHIMETDWTDEDGHVILEPEKPEEPDGE